MAVEKDKEQPEFDTIRIGGLMRCCTSTINHLYPNGPALVGTEGQILQCEYSESPNHRMIFRDGAWEWLREEPPEPAQPKSGL